MFFTVRKYFNGEIRLNPTILNAKINSIIINTNGSLHLMWNEIPVDDTKYVVFYQFQNVTSSPQYSTFLEHIIPRFLTFLQDGEVQFLQEKPTQVCGPKQPVSLHSQIIVF